MTKKIFLNALLLAVIVTLLGSSVGVAYAASGNQDLTATTSYTNRYGKVIEVYADHFVIRNLSGLKKTIQVTSATKVYNFRGVAKTLLDVRFGAWIFASGTKTTGQPFRADTIILTGSTYTGSKYWGGRRVWGTVSSVDTAHGLIIVKTVSGGYARVVAYNQTVFLNPAVSNVTQVKVGMKALVAGRVATNGVILAKIVDAFVYSK